MPDASIGVDVIVGYPTETYDKFLDTYNFLQNLMFHIFMYSNTRPRKHFSFNIHNKVTRKIKYPEVKFLESCH